MFGLDDKIATMSDGATLLVVVVVALVLGLRHATDPDHLAAVTTLIASGKERAARSAARLGFVWGLGHGDEPLRLRPADRALQGVPARGACSATPRRPSA